MPAGQRASAATETTLAPYARANACTAGGESAEVSTMAGSPARAA
ncbi:hypothetical protein [Nonomuraea angiospora]